MVSISHSIVHLSMRFDETNLATGTGFIYQHDGKYFIVTAWHNLTGRDPNTLKNLHKDCGIPNNVVIAITVGNQNSRYLRRSITLPLTDEFKSLFYVHPKSWPMVDVAAIPFDPGIEHIMEAYVENEKIKMKTPLRIQMNDGSNFDVCPIQNYLVEDKKITTSWLGSACVTEELFIPGYPHDIYDYYMQPIWKRATIATSVQDGWNGESKFLIDSASKKGMSGSPVLHYNSNGVIQIGGFKCHLDREAAILAGVYVGRLGINEKHDPQIGIVWHRSVIDEIILGQKFEKLSSEIEVSNGELSESVLRILSSCSRKGLENINNYKTPSRYYVCRQVMKDVDGHVSHERALDAVLENAKHYNGPLAPDE